MVRYPRSLALVLTLVVVLALRPLRAGSIDGERATLAAATAAGDTAAMLELAGHAEFDKVRSEAIFALYRLEMTLAAAPWLALYRENLTSTTSVRSALGTLFGQETLPKDSADRLAFATTLMELEPDADLRANLLGYGLKGVFREHLPELEALGVRSPDWELRLSSLAVLREVPPSEHRDRLVVTLLQDTNRQVLHEAIVATGDLEIQSAVPRLLELLDDTALETYNHGKLHVATVIALAALQPTSATLAQRLAAYDLRPDRPAATHLEIATYLRANGLPPPPFDVQALFAMMEDGRHVMEVQVAARFHEVLSAHLAEIQAALAATDSGMAWDRCASLAWDAGELSILHAFSEALLAGRVKPAPRGGDTFARVIGNSWSQSWNLPGLARQVWQGEDLKPRWTAEQFAEVRRFAEACDQTKAWQSTNLEAFGVLDDVAFANFLGTLADGRETDAAAQYTALRREFSERTLRGPGSFRGSIMAALSDEAALPYQTIGAADAAGLLLAVRAAQRAGAASGWTAMRTLIPDPNAFLEPRNEAGYIRDQNAVLTDTRWGIITDTPLLKELSEYTAVASFPRVQAVLWYSYLAGQAGDAEAQRTGIAAIRTQWPTASRTLMATWDAAVDAPARQRALEIALGL